MTVLDVGCGSGAITSGIARAVGASGQALGIDRDEALLTVARQEYHDIPNLRFEQGDAVSLAFDARFDIVTAARTLQWISQPAQAIARMAKAVRPGGQLVVLDYNHANNSWEPDPPLEFRRFYRAFLDWRADSHWDNLMADDLPALFRAAAVINVEIFNDDETVRYGDADFFDVAGIWTEVIRAVGHSMVAASFLSESERMEAEIAYREWVRNGLRKQTHQMRTVTGEV